MTTSVRLGTEATTTAWTAGRARMQLALRVGAAVWFVLLLAGFFAPGGGRGTCRVRSATSKTM